MVSLNDVQAGLVAYLKAQSSLVTLLQSAADIKEDEWQGTTFKYPAVRIDLGVQYPKSGCTMSEITFGVLGFSEKDSSAEANSIASEVTDLLHNKSFTRNGVHFIVFGTGTIPAIRKDERTWRSEAKFKALVEPST